MRSFGDAIRNGKITMDLSNDEPEQLVKKIRKFVNNTRPRNVNMKTEKESFQNRTLKLLRGREMVFNAFSIGLCSLTLPSRSKEPY